MWLLLLRYFFINMCLVFFMKYIDIMVVLFCKVCVVMVFRVFLIDVIVDLVLIVWRIRLNFDLGRLGCMVIFVLVFFDNLKVLCFFEFVMV